MTNDTDTLTATNVSESGVATKEANSLDFKQVTYKKRRSNTTLGTSNLVSEIKAVESRKTIFISRLYPNTTPEQLQKHLKQNNIQYVNVEKLTIQSNEVAAFKVQIPTSQEKNIFNPETWPQYTIIRPFRTKNGFLGQPTLRSS